jgi:hypothetical protein
MISATTTTSGTHARFKIVITAPPTQESLMG